MRTLHRQTRNNTPEKDQASANYAIILIALVLITYLFGCTMLYSTSSISDGASFFTKQLVWGVVGSCSASFVWFIGYKRLSKLSMLLILVTIILLFIARFCFEPIKGAYRWIKLPGIGSLQPSEYAKLAAVLFTAQFCSENIRFLNNFSSFYQSINYLIHEKKTLLFILLGTLCTLLALNIPFFIFLFTQDPAFSSNFRIMENYTIIQALAFPVILLLLLSLRKVALAQCTIPVAMLMGAVFLGKDLGTTCLIALVTLILYFCAGLNLRMVLTPLAVGLPSLFFLIKNFSPFRWNRLMSFLDPEKYQTGIGYQLWRSLLALGSGNWTGLGFTESRMKAEYLPEDHTDFILSIVGEELGFVFICLIIVVYLSMMFLGVQISIRARSKHGMLLGIGVTSLVVFQSLINVGVAGGALPTKGMPAAFISYGGSNLILCLTCIGILISIAHDSVVPNYNDRLITQIKTIIHRIFSKKKSNKQRAF